MSASISLYFRPVDTFIKETSRTQEWVFYQIVTTVNFYTDEAMLNLAYTKQYTFDNVPYNSSWDWILQDLYTLVKSST